MSKAKVGASRRGARRTAGLAAAAGIAIGLGLWWWSGSRSTTVAVVVPELSARAQAGETAFLANCARCHGENAAGTDQGPPLIHAYYRPNHHGDAAFVLAAKRGVPQHHWRFGNMPPQPQVGDRSLQQIVQYVRELQQANGVY